MVNAALNFDRWIYFVACELQIPITEILDMDLTAFLLIQRVLQANLEDEVRRRKPVTRVTVSVAA